MKIIPFLLIILFISGCSQECTRSKELACCKGKKCAVATIDCVSDSEPVFKGCDKKCIPEWICEKKSASISKTGILNTNEYYCTDDNECAVTSPQYKDNCLQATCDFTSINKKTYEKWNQWNTKNYNFCKEQEKKLNRISNIECLEEAYLIRPMCQNNKCVIKKINDINECEKSPYKDTCYNYYKTKSEVIKKNQSCQKNNDCILFQVNCGDCDCGTPINKSKLEEYIADKEERCEGLKAEMCDLHCPKKELKCINNTCVIYNE